MICKTCNSILTLQQSNEDKNNILHFYHCNICNFYLKYVESLKKCWLIFKFNDLIYEIDFYNDHTNCFSGECIGVFDFQSHQRFNVKSIIKFPYISQSYFFNNDTIDISLLQNKLKTVLLLG